MGIIAESMKGITENIIGSYDARVKFLKDLVVDTRKTIKGFTADRKDWAPKQAQSLADFVNDLTKSVETMLKGFQTSHKEMSETLSESLEKGETDRLKDFKAMMGNIQKGIKDIETYVAKKLKEFDDAHAEMSEQQKKDLAKYVNEIVSAVKRLLGEYGSDMAKARASWQGMASSLAKSRKGRVVVMPRIEVRKAGAVMPRIEAREKVTTVEGAIEEPKKKGGKKGKGKKR